MQSKPPIGKDIREEEQEGTPNRMMVTEGPYSKTQKLRDKH
jgi:hypothetical protein